MTSLFDFVVLSEINMELPIGEVLYKLRETGSDEFFRKEENLCFIWETSKRALLDRGKVMWLIDRNPLVVVASLNKW